MDLISAVKSGRPFRRMDQKMHWIESEFVELIFSKSDLCSENWEIKPEEKPRLQCWIEIATMRPVFFDSSQAVPDPSNGYMYRASWLDEPKEE